jgi:hypothetical protein
MVYEVDRAIEGVFHELTKAAYKQFLTGPEFMKADMAPTIEQCRNP